MRTATTLLPLLAFAAGIIAAPTPLRSSPRAVPDIKTVIRNPAPIDHKLGLSVGNLASVKVDLSSIKNPLDGVKERAAPAIDETIVDPVDVVRRAKPALDHTIADPVDIIN
ncbi:Nn.00g021700.m01.CDS01 [Neocucurbitaria sp. VM-36]